MVSSVAAPSGGVTKQRTQISRVIVETPALLNMVKHCRDAAGDVVGILMGITQKEMNQEDDSLLITQTMPKANKAQMNDLLKTLEQESQKLMDTNEVGFYVNSRMGLCFNRETLSLIVDATKKFKNEKAAEIEIKMQSMKRVETTVDESLFKSKQVMTAEYPSEYMERIHAEIVHVASLRYRIDQERHLYLLSITHIHIYLLSCRHTHLTLLSLIHHST